MAERHPQPPTGKPGHVRRKAAMVLVALLLAGPGYQQLVQTVDARRFEPPGELIDVGDATLHLHCTGAGRPTVILEAGATGFAQSWTWVQQTLSQQTRVCSYDRAGLGWSERDSQDESATSPDKTNPDKNVQTTASAAPASDTAGSTSYTGVEAARNLRTLLQEAQEPGPYVMVGHSMGGPLVQIFTGLYPQAVIGVGLVDPSHPSQLERYQPEAPAAMEQFVNSLRLASTLTHTGVVRLSNVLARNAQGLPTQSYEMAKFFAASPTHLKTSYRELEQWEPTMSSARAHMALGDRPLVVVSATEAREDFPEHFVKAFHQLHQELAQTSSNSRHIKIDGADHFSLLTQRHYAEQTAQALNRLVQRVRQEGIRQAQLADPTEGRTGDSSPM